VTSTSLSEALGGLDLAGTSPVLWVLGLALLGLLPFAAMLTTSFVKFVVVLSILRSALGTPSVPPGPVLTGLAAVMTALVMTPVVEEMAAAARRIPPPSPSTPSARIDHGWAQIQSGLRPLRDFLVRHGRPDIRRRIGEWSRRSGGAAFDPARPPWSVILPSFVLSELHSAFRIGFVVFLPFLAIDLAVATLLMALGMQMLAPTSISLPFKLLVFVLMDGWLLLAEGLLEGYA
jgi:type III secretion protein R